MSRYHFTYYWILDQNKMQIQLHKQDDVVMSAEKSVRFIWHLIVAMTNCNQTKKSKENNYMRN